MNAGRLLADPVRPRLYATLPESNSLAVIDTDSLEVLATFFTGSGPANLALSPDGARLYVANAGATVNNVAVIDLDQLAQLPSLSVALRPIAIAAGGGNRLYLLGGGQGITQVDATTGVLQDNFGAQVAYYAGFLQITPGLDTLYYGTAGLSPSTLARFDVTGPKATLLQQNKFGDLGSNGEGLVIAHNGQGLCFPNGGGNSGNYGTTLIPAGDLDGSFGTFQTGAYPEGVAFSPDDALLYEYGNRDYGIQVFDTHTFARVSSFMLPNLPTSGQGYSIDVTGLAATSGAAGYLFVAGTDGSFAGGAGPLRVFAASSNPPRVVAQSPAVGVAGAAAERGGFVVSRAGGLPSVNLAVRYHVGGSAIGGGDYATLPGVVTIPVGHSEAVIPVTLLPGVNRNHKVKVFLDPSPSGAYDIGKAQSKVFLSDLP